MDRQTDMTENITLTGPFADDNYAKVNVSLPPQLKLLLFYFPSLTSVNVDEVIGCIWIPWSPGGKGTNQGENQTCVSATNVSLFPTPPHFR